MKPAIIVVDMLKDNLKESPRNPYFQEGRSIIPNLQKLFYPKSSETLRGGEKEKVSHHLCLRQFFRGGFYF